MQMEKVIELCNDALWNSVSTDNAKIAVGIYDVERRYGRYTNQSLTMYKVELRDDDVYLVSFDANGVSNGDVMERNHMDVASFNNETKTLTVFDDFSEVPQRSRGQMSFAYFLRHILINHENEISGNNVYRLLREKQLLCPQTAVNVMKYYENIVSIEKLGENFISSIETENFVINTNAKDRHRVLDLPKQVLQYIEKTMAAEENRSYYTSRSTNSYLQAFQKMMTGDGNELIEVIHILEMYAAIGKKIPNKASGNYGSAASPGSEFTLIETLGEIKEIEPSIDCRKLIGYLAKQQMLQFYDNGWSNSNFDPIRFSVTVPSRLAEIYRDYIKMKPVELYPQDLYKSHNVVAIESKIEITEEAAIRFKEYGESLASAYDRKIDNFIFKVPTNYKEFVETGKEFMNCLPTCGEAFMNGLCDIVFIYRNGEKIPKYAIELDKQLQVVQAKTIRDLDIEENDVLEAISSFVKEIENNY